MKTPRRRLFLNDHTYLAKARGLLWAAALLAAGLAAATAQAATYTWNGSGDGFTLDSASNWGGTLPSASGDTAFWNGTEAGSLSLIYTTSAFAGSAGNSGLFLNVGSTQTGSLDIDSGANTSSLRLGGGTVAAGAGAFSLGVSGEANTFNVTLGGGAGTQTFTNNSSNPVTFNSDVVLGTGGGGAHFIALTGSGNVAFDNNIGNSTGSFGIADNSTGIVTLAGANTFTGATTLQSGTLSLTNPAALSGSPLSITGTTNNTLQLLGDTNNTIFAPASVNFLNATADTYNFNVGSLSGAASGNTLILANIGQFGPPNSTDTFNVYGGNNYTLQLGSNATGTSALVFYNNTTVNAKTAGSTVSIPGGMTVNYAAAYTLTFGGAGNFNLGALFADGAHNLTANFTTTGTTILTGSSNLYGGFVYTSAGQLLLSGTSSIYCGGVNVANSASVASALWQSGTNTVTATNTGGGGFQIGSAVGRLRLLQPLRRHDQHRRRDRSRRIGRRRRHLRRIGHERRLDQFAHRRVVLVPALPRRRWGSGRCEYLRRHREPRQRRDRFACQLVDFAEYDHHHQRQRSISDARHRRYSEL